MTAFAVAESVVEGWTSPNIVPPTKEGEARLLNVAVRRRESDKVYVFSAQYLRNVSLWFEDDGEARKVTGWFSESAEGDDSSSYEEMLRDGDVLMGWRDLPSWTRIEDDTPTVTGQGVESSFCNKCGFYGDADQYGNHLRMDGEMCSYMAIRAHPTPPDGLLSELVEALDKIANGVSCHPRAAKADLSSVECRRIARTALAKAKAGEGDRG
jgi:hypothetical protein